VPQNRRLEPTGLANSFKTSELTGTHPGMHRQEAAGPVFARFWIRTELFFRAEPGPLACYPHPSFTLLEDDHPVDIVEKLKGLEF
jgi:hypothetical protein